MIYSIFLVYLVLTVTANHLKHTLSCRSMDSTPQQCRKENSQTPHGHQLNEYSQLSFNFVIVSGSLALCMYNQRP
jgi:hypothetical protein